MTNGMILDEPTLAKMWRVHQDSPRKWRRRGLIVSDEQRGKSSSLQHFYRLSTIEAFHLRAAHGFRSDLPPMPTAAELLAESGRSLLLTSEVAERLGVTPSAIHYRAEYGTLPVFAFTRNTLRFPALHIGIIASKQHTTVSVTTLAEMLGLIEQMVWQLPLTRVDVVGTHFTHYTKESVISLLAELLPPHITPDQWWQMYEQYRDPLTTMAIAIKRCHFDRKVMRRLLEDERLPYIFTPGGHQRIPERVIRQIQAERLALPASEVARAFGATEDVTAGWIETNVLCHARHGGKKAPLCPSRQCLREYAEAHPATSAEVDGADWLAQALEGSAPILASTLLDEMRVVTKAELQEWITQTSAPAVLLPNGDISLSRTAYFAFRRYARRELGLADD